MLWGEERQAFIKEQLPSSGGAEEPCHDDVGIYDKLHLGEAPVFLQDPAFNLPAQDHGLRFGQCTLGQ